MSRIPYRRNPDNSGSPPSEPKTSHHRWHTPARWLLNRYKWRYTHTYRCNIRKVTIIQKAGRKPRPPSPQKDPNAQFFGLAENAAMCNWLRSGNYTPPPATLKAGPEGTPRGPASARRMAATQHCSRCWPALGACTAATYGRSILETPVPTHCRQSTTAGAPPPPLRPTLTTRAVCKRCTGLVQSTAARPPGAHVATAAAGRELAGGVALRNN
jgi:hypothetical protein